MYSALYGFDKQTVVDCTPSTSLWRYWQQLLQSHGICVRTLVLALQPTCTMCASLLSRHGQIRHTHIACCIGMYMVTGGNAGGGMQGGSELARWHRSGTPAQLLSASRAVSHDHGAQWERHVLPLPCSGWPLAPAGPPPPPLQHTCPAHSLAAAPGALIHITLCMMPMDRMRHLPLLLPCNAAPSAAAPLHLYTPA